MAVTSPDPVPGRLRLGLNLGYWGTGNITENLTLAQEADRLGYAVVWAAEAYGSDAVTVLSWIAAQTTQIDVGSAVLQIPARTPAMTAMTAATLDALSGGRFRLGLGVSGPQVSEGWHGVRFDKPLGRTREYVQIVESALRREKLQYHGEHFTLPLPDGPGKAIKLMVHPVRSHLPLYLAAVGPRSLELAGEIADGWLAIFFNPDQSAQSLDLVRVGRRRAAKSLADDNQTYADSAAGGRDHTNHRTDSMLGFDIAATVPVVIADEVTVAADQLRAYSALYIGGMGSHGKNFYHQLAVRMGYRVEADTVQRLYLDRQHRAAAAAVPQKFIDDTALIGSRERIKERLVRYAEAGVTTLSVSVFDRTLAQRIDTLHTMASIVDESGLGA